MSQATVHLADSKILGFFYFTQDPASLARQHLAEGNYTQVQCEVNHTGEEAAEEIFDLTNHPRRQPERWVKYGRGRSVSVGDIVEVDGTKYLCRPNGWVTV